MVSKPRRRQFEAEDVDGVTVIRFSEPILDEEKGWVIKDQVFEHFEKSGQKQLRLDLAAVKFLSSAALGALIALNQKVSAVGGQISLCNLNSETEEVLRATRLDQVFTVHRA